MRREELSGTADGPAPRPVHFFPLQPLLLTENQCIALYDNAKEFVAREHGGVDELAVVGCAFRLR